MEENRPQTLQEEKWNTFTHGLGILFTLIAIPILLIKVDQSGSQNANWGILIFGIGMLAVYVSSTLYHAVQSPLLKYKLQVIDHVSIYFLIGGTYFPVVYQYTDTPTATIFLISQWVIILFGSVLKLFYTGKFEKVSVLVYLFLGWSAVFLIKPFLLHMPFDVFKWLLIGGLAYTAGVIFYRMDHHRYAHSIWHLFVLSGTIAHYIAISRMYQGQV